MGNIGKIQNVTGVTFMIVKIEKCSNEAEDRTKSKTRLVSVIVEKF